MRPSVWTSSGAHLRLDPEHMPSSLGSAIPRSPGSGSAPIGSASSSIQTWPRRCSSSNQSLDSLLASTWPSAYTVTISVTPFVHLNRTLNRAQPMAPPDVLVRRLRHRDPIQARSLPPHGCALPRVKDVAPGPGRGTGPGSRGALDPPVRVMLRNGGERTSRAAKLKLPTYCVFGLGLAARDARGG